LKHFRANPIQRSKEILMSHMGDVEQKIRLGVGSAAAAAAIFAPLDYKWKAGAILTGIYRVSPFRRMFGW
jgi:hypothetical protein